MKTFLRYLAAAVFMLLAASSFATHNRAGEIIVESINGCNSNMVRVTVITYTKTSSTAADRDSVTICWGDDSCEQVVRANGPGSPPQGQPMANDVKENYYVAIHTYSGPGRYTVSMTDPNRNGGVCNVNPPGSENVQFHLQTTFRLFGGQFDGCNSTPVLEYAPIDYACIGEPFVHNPGAWDPDGDSLSYELIVPMQAVNTPVPNYTFPPNLTLNAVTGTMEWITPQMKCEYNVAMIIISWRDGVPIDTTVRDMQIIVFDCEDNHAPKIEVVDEICVVAGDVVEFVVTATDPDVGDKIKLTAVGEPLNTAISPVDNLDIWQPNVTYDQQPVKKTFRWQTACEHITNLPYTVVFRAEDDFFLPGVPNASGLATVKSVRIKVVGPPPLDVQAEANSNRINVNWEKPYKCEDAANDFFYGFSVWRREGSNPFVVDTCTPGLAGKGYTKIANTINEANGRYQHSDTNVERGRTYCYRILARFARRTELGQAYNVVESLASKEICIQLSRDVPLITNVSVLETATSNGAIEVKWTKPVAEDLDTLLNPGPYRYELERASGIAGMGFTNIATFNAANFWQLDQLEFLDQTAILDTRGSAYTYRLAFFVNNETEPIGYSPEASSIFLSIAPTDNQNNLSWDFDVPWVNTDYRIFRRDNVIQPDWTLVGTSKEAYFEDKGLVNGREYCYYVEASGSYGVNGIPSPLINLSQEACAVPVDNVPPCPPKLTVQNICNTSNTKCLDNENLDNRLSWDNPMNICEETDDVVSYKVYYAAFAGEELKLIASIDQSGDTTFIHEPERGIAGCYAVTALDTFLNESAFSNIVCVDNCPNYSLPNAFTPNNDATNDLYIPYPYCFIESIEMEIRNRWGELVFKTKDANINWNGENLKGEQLPEGTYFYTCRIFEQRVTGTVEGPEVLKGYIDLIR